MGYISRVKHDKKLTKLEFFSKSLNVEQVVDRLGEVDRMGRASCDGCVLAELTSKVLL